LHAVCLISCHRRDREPIGNEEGISGIQHHNPPRGRHTRGIFTLLSSFAFKYTIPSDPLLILSFLTAPLPNKQTKDQSTLSLHSPLSPPPLSSENFSHSPEIMDAPAADLDFLKNNSHRLFGSPNLLIW